MSSRRPYIPVVRSPQPPLITPSIPRIIPIPSQPQINIPPLPSQSQLTVPQISVPQISVPQLSVPQISVPQISVPQISVPQISVPPPIVTSQSSIIIPPIIPPGRLPQNVSRPVE